MNFKEEVYKAKLKNWQNVITEKANRIMVEHMTDMDFMVSFLNGDYLLEAHEEFAREVKEGKYDKQCCPINYLEENE